MLPMDPKSVLFSSILVTLLSFSVLLFLARFTYLNPHSCNSLDLCFFPQTLNPAADRRRAYYSAAFHRLLTDGVLSAASNSLCIGDSHEAIALRKIGGFKTLGVSSNKFSSSTVRYAASTFDFVFSSTAGLDRVANPVQFAAKVSETLKPGGVFVLHTESDIDEYSLHSLLRLFDAFTLIKFRVVDGIDSISVHEIIFRKNNETLNDMEIGKIANECSVPRVKFELISKAEQLIKEEPLKPWITLRKNIKNLKFLSRMVDISFKNRYVYIDVGARTYSSSIGSWFKKHYPKQDKPFEIYAVEADTSFHDEYKTNKDVTLLPYAAWIRNETLFFEISREPSRKNKEKGRGMGRIQVVQSSTNFMSLNKIQGFDFALWLKSIVGEMDYVVVKMDVEGTEFNLIPRLIETGAICLIDEMFLECHYNRWQRCCPGKRSPKYQRTYSQCFELLSSLRKHGVLVHQWW